MYGYFDIRENGAAGDGATDDTLAIQQAVDAAGECHGVVVVPPGTYLAGTIRLRPGMEIRGSADFSFREPHGAILQLAPGDHSCLLDMTGAFGAKAVSLCLVGRGGTDGAKPHGIMVDKPDYGRQEDTPCIDNCRVERFGGDGIHLSRIWCFSVRHSHLFSNGGDGLSVRGWDGFVIDNWMSGNGGAGYGTHEENASVTMTGNRIEWNMAGGIVIRNGNHYNITGNYIDRSGHTGFVLERSRVVTFSGNVVYRSGKPDWGCCGEFDSAHVRLENSEGVTVVSNTMNANRDDGGKGEYSPLYGIVVNSCRSCVVAMNTLPGGALRELVRETGNTDCVVKDNPGSLFKV